MEGKTPNASQVEVAVANLIGFRENVIVPNVSWGLGLSHECDMLVLDSKNRFTEVEIKVSLSDLKRDSKKWHNHYHQIISRLIYAVPERMVEFTKTCVPETCGIISVYWGETSKQYKAKWERLCKHRTVVEPSQKQIQKFMHLGAMRIWTLKSKINRMNEIQQSRS